MNPEFFEQSYRMIYGLFSEQFTCEETIKYNIPRVDSTMVAETANKLESGMTTGIKKDGKNKLNIRYHWMEYCQAAYRFLLNRPN